MHRGAPDINLTYGDVPCRSEFSNVPVVAPAPAPGSSPTAAAGGEEEEADVASRVSQQLGRLTWWLPLTVRG